MGIFSEQLVAERDAKVANLRARRGSRSIHTGNAIVVDEQQYNAALQSLIKMEESITPGWLKATQRRYANKHIVPEMIRSSPSTRIALMTGVTTKRKRAGRLGIKVGVIENDPDLFPEFSAPAMASVIEYGTKERWRQLKKLGFTVGRVSTGEMPAKPFLRPAWDRKVKPFMKDMEEAIVRKIKKAI